jgi:hypothetical protein
MHDRLKDAPTLPVPLLIRDYNARLNDDAVVTKRHRAPITEGPSVLIIPARKSTTARVMRPYSCRITVADKKRKMPSNQTNFGAEHRRVTGRRTNLPKTYYHTSNIQ